MLHALTAKFNSTYAQRPVLTTMMTNAVLAGLGDGLAQSITSFRLRKKGHTTEYTNALTMAVTESDRVNQKSGLAPSNASEWLPIPIGDLSRLSRFVAYGFLITPFQFAWYRALTKWIPVTTTHSFLPVVQRVALDQLLFAPIGLGCFFTFMNFAEGEKKHQLVAKFQDIYIPTLQANYVLWPAVQFLNFRVMPLRFQIPFVSSVGIAWTAYLSVTNSKENS